jgi:hypothetical protein
LHLEDHLEQLSWLDQHPEKRRDEMRGFEEEEERREEEAKRENKEKEKQDAHQS